MQPEAKEKICGTDFSFMYSFDMCLSWVFLALIMILKTINNKTIVF